MHAIRKEVALTEYYLTDERWALIAPLLPGREGASGRPGQDNRLFIEAVFWLVRTGSPWRSLPPHFGKWYTNYTRFYRWTQNQVWPRVMSALKADETCEYFYEDGAIRHAPLRRLVAQEAPPLPANEKAA
jgi:transposase